MGVSSLTGVIEGIGEVVLEGSHYEKYVVVERRNGAGDDEKDRGFGAGSGSASGGFSLCEEVLGEVVIEGCLEEEKGNDGLLVCGTGCRITELEHLEPVVVVCDVGVGEAAAVAAEHALAKKRAQNCTDLGKSIMRETTKAQAKEANMQAHRRRDMCHAAAVQEPKNAENISENSPFYLDIFSSKEKGKKYAVSDLVWGKVISHPWWPGQIINPCDASARAIKCQKKDAFLVAYFWDKTFAWCDESQLKPFFPNFSSLKAQTDWDMFENAVKSSLKEVCRRIDAATLCSCLNNKSLFKNYPSMENAGVREGFEHYTVDKSKVVNSLNPRGLIGFIKDLALDTYEGTDYNKLSLVMSKYHIKSFRRWMAIMSHKQTKPIIVPTETECLSLPNITASLSVMQISSPRKDHTAHVFNSASEKPKRKRGRPRKTPTTPNNTESIIMPSSDLYNKTNTAPDKALNGKRHKAQILPDKPVSRSNNIQESSYWSMISAKRPVIIPVANKKSDECIPTASPKRPNIIPMADKKKSDECIPTALMLSFSNNRYAKIPSDMEILRPLSKYGALKGEMEKEIIQGTEIRFKLVFKRLSDAELAFNSLRKHNVFGPSLLSYRLINLPSLEVTNRSGDHGDNMRRNEVTGEMNPTTLVLIFSTKSGKIIPSETELIRMFSCYGPLKDGNIEKEMEGGVTCQVKITFKKHSSAQMAFTSLRKQNVFGPSLLSYRLVNLPAVASKPASKENPVQLSNAIVDKRTEVQNGSVTDISVDPSSIAHQEISRGTVAPSSTEQGTNLDEISSVVPLSIASDCDIIDPQRKRQDDCALETSISPSRCVQGADVNTEMPIINLPNSVPAINPLFGSSHTIIKPCEISPDPFHSRTQAERESLNEIPIDSLNTEEMPTVRLQAEDREVGDHTGEMPIGSPSTREKDDDDDNTLIEMQIDHSGTGHDQEPRPKNLNNSAALENSSPASSTKPISNNGDVLFKECTLNQSPSVKNNPIWQPLESLEIFTRTAQRPHFKKLESYCKEMRDGMAIGLMVTYANLIDSIKKLSIDDDMSTIEQKFGCLEALEENGFNVDLIRARLNNILKIKTDDLRSRLMLAGLENELAIKESIYINTQMLMERNRSDMVKLEEEINALTEESRKLAAEKDRLLDLTVGNGHDISKLKNELSVVNNLLKTGREEFMQVLAQPF